MLLTDGASHCSSLWMLFWLITWYDRLISLWPVVLSFEFYHLNFMVYTLCIIVSQMLFLIIIFIRVWIWIHCTITQLLQYCMQHTQATACHCHWIMVVVVVWDYLFTFPLCGGNLCSKNKKKGRKRNEIAPQVGAVKWARKNAAFRADTVSLPTVSAGRAPSMTEGSTH